MYKEFVNLTGLQLTLLILSEVTTTLSWLFYYRAMKDGLVPYVAVIDKASMLITLLLSFFLLKGPMSPKIIAGAILVTAGLLVLIWK